MFLHAHQGQIEVGERKLLQLFPGHKRTIRTLTPSHDGILLQNSDKACDTPFNMQLDVSVGVLAAVTTLLIELLIVPVFELTRNKLSGFVANRELDAGRCVVLDRSNLLLTYLGVGSIIKIRNLLNLLAVVTRVALRIFLILVVVIWESQLTTDYRRDLVTQHLGYDIENERNLTIVTPIPLHAVFVGNQDCQNTFTSDGSPCIGDRLVLKEPNLQTKYVSECVELLGDQTVVYYALAELTTKGRSIECLNGRKGTEKKTLMTFNNVDTKLYPDQSWRIVSIDVSDNNITDGTVEPYHAIVSVERDDGEKDLLDGHLTFAGKTHHDNNVTHSAYGVFVSRRNSTASTASFAISQEDTFCDGKVLGKWRFGEDGTYCPSGVLSWNYPEIAALFELDLRLYDITTGKEQPFSLKDTLAWILETPIYRFSSPGDGASEMRLRYSTVELFFSFQNETVLTAKLGKTHTTVELESITSVVLVVLTTCTLFFCALSSVMYSVVSRRNRVFSDFDDHGILLSMWKGELDQHYHVIKDDKSSTRICLRLLETGSQTEGFVDD